MLNNKKTAAALKIFISLLVLYFFAHGLYGKYYQWRYNSVKSYVETIESERTYDPDMGYLLPRGEPVFMIDPDYRRTLFFIEGFRGQVGAGIYLEWFEYLHDVHKVNIIAPIVGLQGWEFEKRNRSWTHQEDMRQVLQIYDAYTAHLPEDHRIVIGSQSFGTLSNVTINAKASRSPYSSVFCAPLNTGLEYKSGGRIIQWLATQTHWLQHILPYMKRSKSPDRAGLWDIVNEDNNRYVWENIAKDIINWEEVLSSSIQVNQVAEYMEDSLIPQVSDRNIYVVYGDDDLYFSREGFENLVEIFKKADNNVTSLKLDNTGHMILFDNGAAKTKELFLRLLTE